MLNEQNILFLPGVSGDGAFWAGVGELLPALWRKHYVSWPGLGDQPASPDVTGFAGLLTLAEQALTRPSVIVAQSMGGIIAAQLALKHPALIRGLVLVATSGGLDVSAFGALDWRPDFVATFPNTPSWLLDAKSGLSVRFSDLAVPTLLIWGNDDAISPVAVGRHLASVIPQSELYVISDGKHSMAVDLPAAVAALVQAFLSKPRIGI
ncbi:MAG: alpha/beta hydrolase [Burkholderiaceae bacterium]